jgi:hypothetical protein
MPDKRGKDNRNANARVTYVGKLAPGEYFVRMGLPNPYALREPEPENEKHASEAGFVSVSGRKSRVGRLARLLQFL